MPCPSASAPDAYREFFRRAICGVDIEPLRDVPFEVDLTLRALPGVQMLQGRVHGARGRRTRALLADGIDDLSLIVNLGGPYVVSQGGNELVLADGEATLVSLTEPVSLAHHPPGHVLGLRIPRARLAPLISRAEDSCVRRISHGVHALRLLTDYVAIALRDDSAPSREVQHLVSSHIHDLVAVAVGATRDAAQAARDGGVRAAQLHAIKQDIAGNLRRPEPLERGVGRVGEAVAVAEAVEAALALAVVAELLQAADGVDVPGHAVRAAACRRRRVDRRNRGRADPWPAGAGGPTVSITACSLSWRGWRGSSKAPPSTVEHDRVERARSGPGPSGTASSIATVMSASAEPDRAGDPLDRGDDGRLVEQHHREGLGRDGDGHLRPRPTAARGRRPPPAPGRRRGRARDSLESSAISSISSVSNPASSRKRRASWIGLSSSSPRTPPSEKSLSTTALELERPLAALGVVRGEAAQPVGAHLHVGDLVGEHPVLAELEHRVAGHDRRTRASC